MTVLSIEKFNEQSSSVAQSSERIYQGKNIVPGPIFSLANFKPAVMYCKGFSKKRNGAICIIVREKGFLRIWSETLASSQKTSSKNSSSEKVKEISVNCQPVEADFVKVCQTLLTEYIGPVAPIICKKTLAKNANLTREQFVEILAEKISDPQQSQEFQQAALNQES